MLKTKLMNNLINEISQTLTQDKKTASMKNHEAQQLIKRFRNNTNLFIQAI